MVVRRWCRTTRKVRSRKEAGSDSGTKAETAYAAGLNWNSRLKVVGRRHERPFAADALKAPEHELPEPQNPLDLTKHRLDRALAPAVARSALQRPVPVEPLCRAPSRLLVGMVADAATQAARIAPQAAGCGPRAPGQINGSMPASLVALTLAPL